SSDLVRTWTGYSAPLAEAVAHRHAAGGADHSAVGRRNDRPGLLDRRPHGTDHAVRGRVGGSLAHRDASGGRCRAGRGGAGARSHRLHGIGAGHRRPVLRTHRGEGGRRPRRPSQRGGPVVVVAAVGGTSGRRCAHAAIAVVHAPFVRRGIHPRGRTDRRAGAHGVGDRVVLRAGTGGGVVLPAWNGPQAAARAVG